MAATTRGLVILVGLIVAAAASLLLFRDGVGLVVFLALGVATIVQLVRVAIGSGNGKTLKKLWGAFKDAFWGIG